MNFHDQDFPYEMQCNAKAVIKIDSVYKVKTTILRYMLKSENTLT